MLADAPIRSEVLETLEQWLEAYGQRRIDLLLTHYLQHEDERVVVLGTDRGERYIGITAIRRTLERDMSAFDHASMGIRWATVSTPPMAQRPMVVWAAVEVSGTITVQARPIALMARWSVVLEDHGGKWLIAHSHFSGPQAHVAPDDLVSYRGLIGRFT